MSDLLVQSLGLAILLAGLGWGYWRWIRPRPVLNWQSKLLLMLLIITMVGGFVGSTAWWVADPRGFSWLLPPLASRMLAAAGWSFGILSIFALQHPTSQRIRLALLMLLVYFIPLVIAILLFHLNRFDFAAPITYSFFIIVGLMTALTIGFIVRQPKIIDEQAIKANISPIRQWLFFVGVVMFFWGVALFLTDAGPSPLIWVWPGDLLTSRLISVMLLAIAFGAFYSARFPDTARVMLVILIVYGLGVAVANLWNMLANKPIKVSYVIVFGIMAIVSGGLLIIRARTSAVDE